MPTHYEILGVQPTSEQEVIEAAYKALIRKYHPDRAGDNDRIRDINIAYGVLRSPVKRRAYDVALKIFPAKDVAAKARESGQSRSSDSRQHRVDAAEAVPKKSCPDCGEQVAGAAQLCRYCGYRFREVEPKSHPIRDGCGFLIILAVTIVVSIWLTGNLADSSGSATIEPQTGISTKPPELDVGAMLAANDSTVCGTDEIKNLALSTIDDSYPDFLKAGGAPVTFEAVSATDVKSDVHEITCSANIVTKWFGRTKATSISYKIRPAIGTGYVVEVIAPGLGATEALSSHMLISQQEQRSGQKATIPTADTSEGNSITRQPPTFPYVEKGEPGRAVAYEACANAGLSEGGYFREESGEIIVLKDRLCRTATRAEAKSIMDNEANSKDGDDV